jgi:hypothetical protein
MNEIPERPMSKIIQDIVGHLAEIIRSELRLVQAELRQDLREASAASIYLIVAGVSGLYALGFLLLGAVYAISFVMPMWMAAASVGFGLGILALVLAVVGRSKLKRINLKPERTIQTLEESIAWFKRRAG